MALTDDLAAAQPSERPGIKARAIAALANLDGQTFTKGLFTATLVNPHVEGNDLVLSLIVMRAGKDVTPADLNPIRIVNPDIGVWNADRTRDINPRAFLLALLADLIR